MPHKIESAEKFDPTSHCRRTRRCLRSPDRVPAIFRYRSRWSGVGPTSLAAFAQRGLPVRSLPKLMARRRGSDKGIPHSRAAVSMAPSHYWPGLQFEVASYRLAHRKVGRRSSAMQHSGSKISMPVGSTCCDSLLQPLVDHAAIHVLVAESPPKPMDSHWS